MTNWLHIKIRTLQSSRGIFKDANHFTRAQQNPCWPVGYIHIWKIVSKLGFIIYLESQIWKYMLLRRLRNSQLWRSHIDESMHLQNIYRQCSPSLLACLLELYNPDNDVVIHLQGILNEFCTWASIEVQPLPAIKEKEQKRFCLSKVNTGNHYLMVKKILL